MQTAIFERECRPKYFQLLYGFCCWLLLLFFNANGSARRFVWTRNERFHSLWAARWRQSIRRGCVHSDDEFKAQRFKSHPRNYTDEITDGGLVSLEAKASAIAFNAVVEEFADGIQDLCLCGIKNVISNTAKDRYSGVHSCAHWSFASKFYTRHNFTFHSSDYFIWTIMCFLFIYSNPNN